MMTNFCKTCIYRINHKDDNTGGGCAICIHNPILMDYYEEDIKRCPFCGDTAELIENGCDYKVQCINCHTTTATYDSKKEAIFNWNRRI